MTPDERRRLSKFLSLILRHQPEKLALRLDAEGFVPIANLLGAVRRERGWSHVSEEQVREVVARCDKQRYEIQGDRIRARYGHSVSQQLAYDAVEPPGILYHGTSPAALAAIRREGLRSMRRQYVHLSTSPEQAQNVGRRHSAEPVLLTIRAREAWQAGVLFHRPEERLYLAETVPPEFIDAG
jgi:putative RNA 2'-phosphotransferase